VIEAPSEDGLAQPSAARDWFRRVERVLPVLVVALAAVLSLRRLDNTDTWWHLAAGRWIVTHGSVPATDPLSWTVRDHAWTNVQWLFDVLIYGLYRLGGPSLLVISAAVSYSAATALLLVNLRRHVGSVLAALLGAWAVVISQERFAIRPEMVSYLLLQVILWLYATGRVPGRKRLWFLPAVMCLFANCHSLFIVGEVVIVCQMAGVLLSDAPVLPPGWRRPVDPRVRSQVLATGAAAILATVVNPFGAKGALFPFVLISRINGDYPFFRTIGEFKRPFEGYFVTQSVRAYRLYFYFAVAVVLGALVLTAFRTSATGGGATKGARRADRRRRERGRGRREVARSRPVRPPREGRPEPSLHVDLADIAVFVGVGYLSTLARRNMALFAMAAGPGVASCLSVLVSRIRAAAPQAAALARRAVAVVLAPALLAACWFVASNGFYRRNDEMHEFGLGAIQMYFPIRAAAFMKAQNLPGPLFNDFTTGGYLSWAQPIGGGVYVDGRTEVYDVDFLGPYIRQVQRPGEWQAEMDRRGVQTVCLFHWWPNHQALVRYLSRDGRWAVVYFDETSVIAVRREGNTDAIERAAAAFGQERSKTEQMLLETPKSWQWQIARARGNRTYASLLAALGQSREARPFQEQFGRLNPRRG
jgi:hypothetical protein